MTQILDEVDVRRYLVSEALNRRDEARRALGPSLREEGLWLLDIWLDWAVDRELGFLAD